MTYTGFTAEHHYHNSHVYQMDCMELMMQTPDKYYDLGVVDPPYGLGDLILNKGRFKRYEAKNGNWDIIPEKLYFYELRRVCKNVVIWGGNYFTDFLPPTNSWIIWDKMRDKNISYSDAELAWTNIGNLVKISRIQYDGFIGRDKDGRIHADVYIIDKNINEKPIALYSWILDNYAKPGWRILDTHLGSQSSRIAAYKKGFEFWATELDADYFNEGNERFMKAVKMPLFENLPPEQLQMF